MTAKSVYKEVLLDHFHHPRNKGDLSGADIVRRGSNPRCGDDLEVGVCLEGGRLASVRFRGRGCSICIASASMMTEAATGQRAADARGLCAGVRGSLGGGSGVDIEPGRLPAGLQALSAVLDYPARKRCVLLSWEALADALDGL
jgi:nitrogen fixation NifU-like protein